MRRLNTDTIEAKLAKVGVKEGLRGCCIQKQDRPESVRAVRSEVRRITETKIGLRAGLSPHLLRGDLACGRAAAAAADGDALRVARHRELPAAT